MILQIGDSHTSADFLTGELRRRLQARYGNGRAGYMTAGQPHIGVRTSSLKISVSSGWTYKSLQRPDARAAEFWLVRLQRHRRGSGRDHDVQRRPAARTFDMIEIEAVAQPRRRHDRDQARRQGRGDPSTFGARGSSRLSSGSCPDARTDRQGARHLDHHQGGRARSTSRASRSTTRRPALTYNSVGYPGAQIDLLNKLDNRLFASDLQRLDPQIVVLSFGTNEASNEISTSPPTPRLRAGGRQDQGGAARRRHRGDLAARLRANCRRTAEDKEARARDLRRPTSGDAVESPPRRARTAHGTRRRSSQQMREAQRDIRERNGLVYWNWASIMPQECGAHRWSQPRRSLMAKDHVHFTIAGYKKSAERIPQHADPDYREGAVAAPMLFPTIEFAIFFASSFRSPGS